MYIHVYARTKNDGVRISMVVGNIIVAHMYCSIAIYLLRKLLYLVILYVTRFWKTDRIVTLGLFYLIGPANGYNCTLHMHSAITTLGRQVCYSRTSFADPVNS